MSDHEELKEVLFSKHNLRDIRVPVLLDSDEYIFARDYAAEQGISASAYFRKLLNDDRKRLAQNQLSAEGVVADSAKSAQDLNTIITALAQLVKKELS